jgi:hypothetical protein
MTSFCRCALAFATTLIACVGARADFISSTLGAAGPSDFALLTLSGATDIALNGPGTTNGNVGISSPSSGTANLQLNASGGLPAIVGNLFLGNSATLNNAAQVSGSVFTNQNALLFAANTAAINAASTFAGLATTQSVGSAINGNITIIGTPGLNVVDVSAINLGNGQTLTLSGPAGSEFIINSPSMTLNSGRIILAGGVTANDVVFNLTGTGNDLQTSGGLNNESVINGVVLDAKGSVGMAPGLINGELIAGGQSVHLVSGASVNAAQGPPAIPEPSGWLLFGTGLLVSMRPLRLGRR